MWRLSEQPLPSEEGPFSRKLRLGAGVRVFRGIHLLLGKRQFIQEIANSIRVS